ncbi:MAG: DNA polymerase III subunit beta [Acidimicrobiaceae bacterium]|nr:DNA polymerase III subunit beta [Acidimicrobiaceae bacterium]
MKFHCEKNALFEALNIAGRAPSRSGMTPGVRLSLEGANLQISGKDSDLLIEVSLQVMGIEDGTVILPSALTTNLIKSLPEGLVEFTSDDSSAEVIGSRSKFIIQTLLDIEPPFVKSPSGDMVTVNEESFKEGLRQVIRAAAKDDARDVMYTGVLFAAIDGGLRMVATDGMRLAIRDIAGMNVLGAEAEVIVPARALSELEKVLSYQQNPSNHLSVEIGSKDAIFNIGDISLTTRLIEEKYRDYRQILQASYPRRLIVEKKAFLESVRRLRIMAKENREVTHLRMDIEEGSVKLSVRSPQVGQATEDIDGIFVGESFTIAFDPDLLLDGAEGVASETVAMEFTEMNKAACISNSDDNSYTYLLMPIRF